ncbi:hypothetical protein C8R43DRAFT_1196820 [Mycena crocata]|nr:hypothetical protein C8R43DRAFT_1196820 [Mycena crocata]
MSTDHRKHPSHRPPPIIGTAAIIAESQGTSFWVGSPPPSRKIPIPAHGKSVHGRGTANSIPTEVALEISKYLDVRDLARSSRSERAQVWRPLAMASHASPEFIRAECERYNLVVNGATPETISAIRDLMERYNFAWSTLQFSGATLFSVPQTNALTVWAGSHNWQSGNRFMGESNGYVYDVSNWVAHGPAGGQSFQARVCLHQLPSLRTGETDFRRIQIDQPLKSHFVKAVTVDPVARRIAVLEFNNQHTYDIHSRIPILHIYDLNGHWQGSVIIRVGFQPTAEVFHLELHGDMVCIIANHNSSNGPTSETVIQNWAGAEVRNVHVHRRCSDAIAVPFCTGFQFITNDLYIMTERAKTEARDGVPSCIIRVGHVRRKMQIVHELPDALGSGWTPNRISLIRNIARYSPVTSSAPFHSNAKRHLFGLKYDYRGFDGVWKSNVCVFVQSTVESWLNLYTPERIEPMQWIMMPKAVDVGPISGSSTQQSRSRVFDPTNPEGLCLVGRRMVWGDVGPRGGSLHLVDFNAGASSLVQQPNEAPRGDQWKTMTMILATHPRRVSYTVSTPLCDLTRIIPHEDGLLIKRQYQYNIMAPYRCILLSYHAP